MFTEFTEGACWITTGRDVPFSSTIENQNKSTCFLRTISTVYYARGYNIITKRLEIAEGKLERVYESQRIFLPYLGHSFISSLQSSPAIPLKYTQVIQVLPCIVV